MANRNYKNIKRFVDNLSKEVEDTMEGGGGTGGMYQITVYASNQGYPAEFTTFVDTKGLSTFTDFINYLSDKRYLSQQNFYPIAGTIDSVALKGVYAGLGSIGTCAYTGASKAIYDYGFTISYLTNASEEEEPSNSAPIPVIKP